MAVDPAAFHVPDRPVCPECHAELPGPCHCGPESFMSSEKTSLAQREATQPIGRATAQHIGRDSRERPAPHARRRHKLPAGECKSCDREKGSFHPPHDASDRCESGKHSHCSCDTCF
jgi:hypothetical protein